MKLFNRTKNSIPETRRPDYDAISKMEREFKMDDDGFDERYDEMLLTAFKKEWQENQWDGSILEDKLYDLMSDMVTMEFQCFISDLIDSERKHMYDRRNHDGLAFEAERLRYKMNRRKGVRDN